MPEYPPLQVAYNQPVMVGKETEYMAQAIAAASFPATVRSRARLANCWSNNWAYPKYS